MSGSDPRCSWFVGLVLIGLAGCERDRAPDRPVAVKPADPAYRTELLDRLAADQAIRDTFVSELKKTGSPSIPTIRRMNGIDSANTGWLKPRIQRDGWPTRKAVGKDGVEAAFLLVQHADHDVAFQETMLPLLVAAYRAGEVDGQDVALLTDRVAKARGRPQPYGTQTSLEDGKLRFDPIDDSANVDARRASLGLPSLAVYRRYIDSVMGPARPPTSR